MKVMALVAGLLIGGIYIDSQRYHGHYVRAGLSMTQQVGHYVGLRR